MKCVDSSIPYLSLAQERGGVVLPLPQLVVLVLLHLLLQSGHESQVHNPARV